MLDYQQHLGHVARASAERDLDALTPTVLAAERKQRQIQTMSTMQMAATRMLREVEKAEALGATAAVASLRERHDKIQVKAKAKRAEINKVVPIA